MPRKSHAFLKWTHHLVGWRTHLSPSALNSRADGRKEATCARLPQIGISGETNWPADVQYDMRLKNFGVNLNFQLASRIVSYRVASSRPV